MAVAERPSHSPLFPRPGLAAPSGSAACRMQSASCACPRGGIWPWSAARRAQAAPERCAHLWRPHSRETGIVACWGWTIALWASAPAIGSDRSSAQVGRLYHQPSPHALQRAAEAGEQHSGPFCADLTGTTGLMPPNSDLLCRQRTSRCPPTGRTRIPGILSRTPARDFGTWPGK
jgi:hypothetical protein